MTKTQKKKQNVALSSVFASAGLTIIKLVVGILSGSMGIISEAAHSALDFGAALITYFAVKISGKPADANHHYGHGKVESVSALIETGLLFLTSGWIIYESIHRLITGKVEIETTWYTFAVIIVSIVVDISRSRALKKVAKETNSQALEADALHFSSDILSSLVVLIGLIFVGFGINSADIYAAIGVSFFVAFTGYQLGKRTIEVLTDTAPLGLQEEIIKITNKIQGVIGIEKVRVRALGPEMFIDMTVHLSRKFPLIKAHSITSKITAQIRKKFPNTDITVHVKPIPLNSETVVERIKISAAKHNLEVYNIVVYDQNHQKYLSYGLEVNEDLTIKEAHTLATNLEKTIKEEIGDDIEINSHIEPLKSKIIDGKKLTEAEEKNIREKIEMIIGKTKTVKNMHHLKTLKAQKKISISFHCTLADNTPLEKAHNVANHLEYLIRETMPKIERVIVHTEPHIKGDKGCHG